MSPPSVCRLSRRPAALLLAVVVPVGLACSGLPVPGAISGVGVGDPELAPDPAPEADGDAVPVPVPAPAPASPDALFVTLDPAEAPPWERGRVECPAGTMTIRYPKGKTLSIYCATTSGVRSGPYTEWQRNQLVVAATNANGKLDGTWTRWEQGAGGPKKVEQQTWAAGVATGDHAEWDLEGRLLVRGRLVDGRKDGRFIERRVEDGAIVPGGACYAAGTEVWRTADEAELVGTSCAGGAPAGSQASD